jgi:hypothetical protein
MATLKSSTAFYHEVTDPFAHNFVKMVTSFTNLMWQLVVNEAHEDKIVCFYPVQSKHPELGKWEIGLVFWNESGYQPTSVTFVPEVDFDKAMLICEAINNTLFGISPELGNLIVDRSMRSNSPVSEEVHEQES